MTSPVSGSTSTSQTWQPLGKVSFWPRKVRVLVQPALEALAASLVGLNAAIATSFSVTLLSVPLTVKLPSANSMSCSAASSRWPASFLPLAITLSAAMNSAEPPITVEREPMVPMPKATRSVSPSM